MMKREFDILSNIESLVPPAELYDTILSRIDHKISAASEIEFDKLNTISSLEPPAALFNKIESKLNKSNKLTVSKKWISAAAAVFAVIVCVEFLILTNSTKPSASSEVESLVQKDTQGLYYE